MSEHVRQGRFLRPVRVEPVLVAPEQPPAHVRHVFQSMTCRSSFCKGRAFTHSPRMLRKSEVNQEVAVDKLDADSCGKLVACMPPPPRFIPVPGPPPPGLATAVRGPRLATVRVARNESGAPITTPWPACLGMPAWRPPVDRIVENPALDHRKPPKKSESGVDSKHGCCRLNATVPCARSMGHEHPVGIAQCRSPAFGVSCLGFQFLAFMTSLILLATCFGQGAGRPLSSTHTSTCSASKHICCALVAFVVRDRLDRPR